MIKDSHESKLVVKLFLVIRFAKLHDSYLMGSALIIEPRLRYVLGFYPYKSFPIDKKSNTCNRTGVNK